MLKATNNINKKQIVVSPYQSMQNLKRFTFAKM